jgi:RNA polymerase sigma-70 factor (ECF subfamily)
LLLQIRDVHDAASWQTFLDIYAPLVHRYCRRRGLQDADAADVCQEVLAQVARSIRTFEYQPERGRFRDWLGQVTRSKLGRFVHKQRQRERGCGCTVDPEMLDDVAGAEVDAEWTDEFNARVLRASLERIRPHFAVSTWQAFALVWLENRPTREVARELNLAVAAVYVAKSRVLKCLRQDLLHLADHGTCGEW